jgi:acetate---CoA ligase (ADP-forming)
MNINLKTLFNPRAVAVIGAADEPKKLGYAIFANLAGNKKRKVYPVNPTFKKVMGRHCYASIKKISAPIDLAVIAVKPEIVPVVLKECGEKKIHHAIIITAGFKEIGPEGEKRERELKAIAKKYKINLVGPNCLGVMDTHSNLNATFGNDLPKAGSIAFVSQSGAVGTAMLDWAALFGVGFSKFISFGNEAGATENDFLEYLGADKQTTAILMYLEGVSDGQRFFRLAKRICKKKPVLILKAGISERGQQAVSSHTGSLAPSHEVFKTACRQSGVMVVESLGEMFDGARLFNAGFLRAPNNWVILTNGGGPSIVTADLIEAQNNLSLCDLSEAVKKKLRVVLPPSAAVGNPVDIIGDAPANRYAAALKILTAEKSVEGIIVLLTPQKVTEIKETAQVIAKYKTLKPILPLFIGGQAVSAAAPLFAKNKIANFTDPEALVELVAAMAPKIPRKKSAVKHPSSGQPAGRQMWFDEALVLLTKYGLHSVGTFVDKCQNLRRYHDKISFPWAMKVMSEQVVHKTDVGGVELNVNSIAEAEAAWERASKSVCAKFPGAKIDGFVVQPMIKGVELIIGMKRDPNFGPVIMFGLGGIFVEVLKDISIRLAPVDMDEAVQMISEIKSAPVLMGARGQKALDIKALAKILVALSHIALKEKSVLEIDLNPVIATESGVDVVDTRIIVKK